MRPRLVLLLALLLAACTPAAGQPEVRTQVEYRGVVGGGFCEPGVQCGMHAPHRYTLSMAGSRTVELTGSGIDFARFMGKKVEIEGTIPGMTQRMWIAVEVQKIREVPQAN